METEKETENKNNLCDSCKNCFATKSKLMGAGLDGYRSRKCLISGDYMDNVIIVECSHYEISEEAIGERSNDMSKYLK